MHTTCIVCLSLTLCGLAIANTVERYLNFDPADFDAEKTLQDTKHKVKELMTNTTKDFQIAHLFLAFTYNDISNRLGMKMTEELDRLHLAVKTNAAHVKGRRLRGCTNSVKNKLEKLQENTEFKFVQCEDITWKEFLDDYYVLIKILESGHKAIRKINNIDDKCFIHVTECHTTQIRIANFYIKIFNEKLNYYSAYRKLIFDLMTDKYMGCLGIHFNKGINKINGIRQFGETCLKGKK